MPDLAAEQVHYQQMLEARRSAREMDEIMDERRLDERELAQLEADVRDAEARLRFAHTVHGLA